MVARSQMTVIAPRTKKGQAISAAHRTPAQIRALDQFITEATGRNDLDEWRRGCAVRGYIDGRSVVSLGAELRV